MDQLGVSTMSRGDFVKLLILQQGVETYRLYNHRNVDLVGNEFLYMMMRYLDTNKTLAHLLNDYPWIADIAEINLESLTTRLSLELKCVMENLRQTYPKIQHYVLLDGTVEYDMDEDEDCFNIWTSGLIHQPDNYEVVFN